MKKYLLLLTVAVVISACAGCDSDKTDSTVTTMQTTQAVKETGNEQLKKDISDCIAAIAKADKTNALEDELVKYPEYYYNSENGFTSLDELKQCIRDYFYTCDTEYKVQSVKDVTTEKKKEIEQDLLENFEAKLKVEQVAEAVVDYKYTNYSTDDYIDDIDFQTETQYFIKISGQWYYGWGLDLNSEHYEYEAE